MRSAPLVAALFVAGCVRHSHQDAGYSSDAAAWVDAGGPACPPGRTLCRGACVDVANDVQNCGLCGLHCRGGLQCRFAQCAADVCPGWMELGGPPALLSGSSMISSVADFNGDGRADIASID